MTVTRYELQAEVSVVAEGQPYETPDTLRRGSILVSEYDYDALYAEAEALKARIIELEAQRETQRGQALDQAIANQLLQKEIDRLNAEAGLPCSAWDSRCMQLEQQLKDVQALYAELLFNVGRTS